MSRTMNLVRGVAVAGLFAVLASCDMPHNTVGPTYAGGSIFKSYVALGNSLTAGYQSGGINDSTQSAAYPVLLAQQFGTRFAFPALANPGCPPPIDNFFTQARVTPTGYPPSTDSTCFLRTPNSVTDVLNNVAVPGANVVDLTSPTGTFANPYTTFVLGGLTQAQRALIAKPTFATIWIGNNDVLEPALTGEPAGATPLASFTQSYDALINQLMSGAPKLKGVLIGVVQVAAAPQLFPAAALQNPQFVGGLELAAGTPITINPDCYTAPGDQSLINIQIISFLAQAVAQGAPAIIACRKGDVPGYGDFLVLDTEEQAQVAALIDSYNAYIQQKAQSIGFAYWDPNGLLAQLAGSGQIDYPPNLASPTQPFGPAISLDGIHPSSSTHILIANALIQVINQKYGTSVRQVP